MPNASDKANKMCDLLIRKAYFVSNWYEKKEMESADSKLIHCKRLGLF